MRKMQLGISRHFLPARKQYPGANKYHRDAARRVNKKSCNFAVEYATASLHDKS